MVSPHESKTITGHTIVGWGAHTEKYACAYLTAAADVGMSKRDIDLFLKRLDKNFQTFKKKSNIPPQPGVIDKEESSEDNRKDISNGESWDQGYLLDFSSL